MKMGVRSTESGTRDCIAVFRMHKCKSTFIDVSLHSLAMHFS